MQDNVNKKDPRISYWRDVIARAKRHPVSCYAFCIEEGIPQASFYNWRDKLSKAAVSKSSVQLPTVFAEVKPAESTSEEVTGKYSAAPSVYLETSRMILRVLRSNDEDLLLDLDSDPDVVKYLTDGAPSTREDIRAALDRTQDLYNKHGGKFGFWAAIEKATGHFIGWFHFRPSKKDPDNVKRIELGYRLKKSFWGKGYATEGSKALIAKGFSEFGVNEVFATTMKRNVVSQKLWRKWA